MTAPAALLSLKSFTLYSGWPQIACMTCDDFDEFLAERGLLWKENPCPVCQQPRKTTKQNNAAGDSCKKKFECFKRDCRSSGTAHKVGFLKGTFFETLRGDRKKIMLCSYLYTTASMSVAEMARNVEVQENTIVQWTQWFRDVMAEDFNNSNVKIGGPGQTVQIDETCIVKRKHNVGRMVRDGWLVGGIQDNSRAVFVEITARRDQTALEAIITKYVQPGTKIITDCWAGYNRLSTLGYLHETVNHSQNFVNPTTGHHTQRVESLWSHLKRGIKPKCGLKGDLWDDHYFEALWRFKYHDEPKFYELWAQISKKYPLT